MTTHSNFRRAFSAGVAIVYSLIIGAAVFVVLPAQASAQLVALPEPTASTATPSGSCQWMGEFHTMGSTTESLESTHEGLPYTVDGASNFEINAVTAPVAGQTCGILWNAESNFYQTTVQSAWCTPNTTDTYTGTYTNTGTGSGTGNLWSGFNTLNGNTWLNFNASGNGGTLSTVYDYSNCVPDSSHTGPWGPGVSNFCYQSGWTSEGFYVPNTNVQAYVGSCTYDQTQTLPNGYTFTAHYQTSWRMRKINCDPTVNTDGGAKSDCQEYEDKTNPLDSSDDLLSEETQNVLAVAELTENQCLGQVAKLGAKDAASGKGVKEVFEYWNLVGVPGITENSTFQQKMDAVRDYCKAN